MTTPGLPPNGSSTRIVVVDDSALFRLIIRDALKTIPGCNVVGTAKDGHEALKAIDQHKPDLVTLDVEMPGMDGIQTLKAIAKQNIDVAALMVSRLTESGAQSTTDALLNGAFDFVLKPSGGTPIENRSQLRDSLAEKIGAFHVSRAASTEAARVSSQPGAQVTRTDSAVAGFRAVVIGTSTGGPETLRCVIPQLSADLPVPVIVVQHMPAGYTSALAKRLNEHSKIRVLEAEHDATLQPGTVTIARGGQQMQLIARKKDEIKVRLTDDPPEHGCHPSIDYLLRSAVVAFDGALLTVIMTGMGRDGVEGCRLVRDRGGRVLAQSAETCVVYGMPKAVIEQDLANRVVPRDYIASAINREFGKAV